MAQHDYNIANDSFPTVRTDINNVLSAINSSNSGTSRPSSAVQGTVWLDTTNSGSNSLTLKIYDGSDDISIGTIDTSSNTINLLDSVVSGVSFKQEGTNFTDSLLIGHSTTGTLSSATENVGVGLNTLDALTSGVQNTVVGFNAGTDITSGTSNTLIGRHAGTNIHNQHGSTAVGQNAIHAGNPARAVAVGSNALFGIRGNENTAIGSNALKGVTNTDGAQNTGVGYKAGYGMSSGNYNILLGVESGQNITTGSGNVIIGGVDAAAVDSARTLKIAGHDGSTTTTWITGSSAGVVTLNAANVTQQALTSSSNAVAWDASAKPNAVHITTENTTFSAPSNAVEGAFICLEINYNGSHTIGWNTVFEFSASTEPTTTDTDAKTDIFVFRYNGAIWQEVGRTLNLSES